VTEAKKPKCVCAVRIRGTVSAPIEVRETLRMLQLARNHNAVLIDDSPSFVGMLKTARNFVTWGEPSKEMVNMLIKKRGRLLGNKKLTDEYAQTTNFKSLDELANAIFDGRVQHRNLPKMQPVFRLHPPSKGFKGKIKRSYGMGGELGYRGEHINELIKRML
jgi:large subunit ribosomal protein L30